MPQRGGGGGDSASTPPSSVRHQLSSRGNSDTTVNKMARGASLSRSQTRATAYSKNGSADRPEHLSSSFSRTATEEGATAAQGGEASFALGVAASRAMGGGGGGGGGGGNRRCVSDMTSSHRYITQVTNAISTFYFVVKLWKKVITPQTRQGSVTNMYVRYGEYRPMYDRWATLPAATAIPCRILWVYNECVHCHLRLFARSRPQ